MSHGKRQMTPADARSDHWQMMRFMVLNAGLGMLLGLLVAGSIMLLDLGGIGTHIARARNPTLPVLLIAFPMALVFGAAVTASAIWLMPYERKFACENRQESENRKEDDDKEDPDRQPR